jgi:hypothetical protein
MSADELVDRIVAAIEAVEGLRPAVPAAVPTAGWLPEAGKRLAVDLSPEIVDIRVVASALPLPPLLNELAAAVGALLTGREWSGTRVRVTVVELDAEAFGNNLVT